MSLLQMRRLIACGGHWGNLDASLAIKPSSQAVQAIPWNCMIRHVVCMKN